MSTLFPSSRRVISLRAFTFVQGVCSLSMRKQRGDCTVLPSADWIGRLPHHAGDRRILFWCGGMCTVSPNSSQLPFHPGCSILFVVGAFHGTHRRLFFALVDRRVPQNIFRSHQSWKRHVQRWCTRFSKPHTQHINSVVNFADILQSAVLGHLQVCRCVTCVYYGCQVLRYSGCFFLGKGNQSLFPGLGYMLFMALLIVQVEAVHGGGMSRLRHPQDEI